MRHLKVHVPRSLTHPLTRLRVKHSQGECVIEVDATTQKIADVGLPDGVTDDEVEITGEYCNARGQRDPGMDVVQVKAAVKPVVPPKAPEKPPEAQKVPEVVKVDLATAVDEATTALNDLSKAMHALPHSAPPAAATESPSVAAPPVEAPAIAPVAEVATAADAAPVAKTSKKKS